MELLFLNVSTFEYFKFATCGPAWRRYFSFFTFDPFFSYLIFVYSLNFLAIFLFYVWFWSTPKSNIKFKKSVWSGPKAANLKHTKLEKLRNVNFLNFVIMRGKLKLFSRLTRLYVLRWRYRRTPPYTIPKRLLRLHKMIIFLGEFAPSRAGRKSENLGECTHSK